jgi:HD-GYP domain-containing protein (c-di-GMP phosphodiesterase class II)
MSANRFKIEVNALKEGMFVSDLDCPWHETPFPLQGFYIRLDDDVKALSEYCKNVYIDVKKQKTKPGYTSHATSKSSKEKDGTSSFRATAQIITLPPIVIKSPQHYQQKVSIKKEVSKASKLHSHVYEAIDHVFSTIEQGGEVSIKETETVAEGMVASIVRNPDALVWLSKLGDQDAYSYQHSVKASIWALVFGRHLGLCKDMMKSLAMGVLLAHIGKAKVASEVIGQFPDLNDEQMGAYQHYVQHSVELLSSMEHIPAGVTTIIEYHQERHNGTGYPKGVTGERIPLLAKIAGLVDYYQELITPRANNLGLSPLDAVAQLYELRNIGFQQDLVERFIEAVGVYPTGTLVELSSKEVGIITGHNMDRRLLPKVMVVLDADKHPLKCGKVIDLKEHNSHAKPIYIKDSLPKGAYDIDENQYLLTGATSKWSWRHFAGSLAAG